MTSQSDTEVLVELIAAEGFTQTLEQLTGMFAIAVVDNRDSSVTLARDRLGQKPLFYRVVDEQFSFGSDLSVFSSDGLGGLAVDCTGAEQFLDYGYVQGARTLLDGVCEVPAGCAVCFESSNSSAQLSRWWTAPPLADEDGSVDLEETLDRLDAELRRAVRLQLRADVPVGILLSGGVDSALVASYVRELQKDVPAFIASFADSRFDESSSALRTADSLGLDPRLCSITDADLQQELERMLGENAQPVADPSILPTRLLARFASNDVRVVLGGDGADELFGGYERYRLGADIVKRARELPVFMRRATAAAVRGIPDRWLDAVGARLAGGRSSLGVERLSRRLAKASALLDAADGDDENAYQQVRGLLLSSSHDPLVPLASLDAVETRHTAASTGGRLMYDDLLDYLPNAVLTKVDRGTMRSAVESRAPFLDHHLVEWSLGVPLEHKLGARQSKRCLRALASRRVSPELAIEPKRGFSPPMARVMTEDMRTRVYDQVASRDVRDMPESIRSRLDARVRQARSSTHSGEHVLFNALVLTSWWTNVGAVQGRDQ